MTTIQSATPPTPAGLQQRLLCDVPSAPWRNGGGRTRELLAWPAADDWCLRVSVAEVAQDGAFSAFQDVERWFAVIGGAGVLLDLQAAAVRHGPALPGGAVRVDAAAAPLCFDGAAAPRCRLLDGPTEDLNFMLRRPDSRHCMRRAVPGSAIGGRTRWRGLYAAQPVRLQAGDARQTLAAGTLLWSADPAPSIWRLYAGDPPVQAWWLILDGDA